MELPRYDEEDHRIENYNPELMPEIKTYKGDIGRLVEYREEESKVILEMDMRHIVEYDEEKIEEEMEDVVEDLYQKAREL